MFRGVKRYRYSIVDGSVIVIHDWVVGLYGSRFAKRILNAKYGKRRLMK